MKLSYGVISMVICGMLTLNAESLMLSTAYELALKNEPHLRSLALRTDAIKESTKQSRARLNPQIQGNLSAGHYEYDGLYLKKPVKENYTSYSLSATQPLYHPELWQGVDEAKAREKATKYQLQSEAQKLGLDVGKAYFELLKTQSNIELYQSQKEYYETKYKQLEEMLKFGLTNRIDLLDAKVHSDKALSEWLAEQKRFNVAKLHLEHLIKSPVSELPHFDFSVVNTDTLFNERSIWENKLNNNPNLQASLASKEMAVSELSLRKYGHFPKVDLSFTHKETYTQDTYSHKYDNQAIFQMSLPLYEGGATQSRVREGMLLLDAAQEDVEFNRLDTKLKFEEQWAGWQLNIETLQALKESEKSAELYVESVDKANKVGLKSLVDLLEAKAKLFGIKRDTINAGYELVNNYLSILDVSGELNSENIELLENMAIH
jgi:outer membrane protein